MNNLDKRLREDGSKIHLLKSEKEALRQRIINTPVHQVQPQTLAAYLWHSRAARVAVMAFVTLIVISTPLTYAAQMSAPGDLLHGLEINVIEAIERATQLSPESRIAYSTDRLEERLTELQSIPDAQLTADYVVETRENIGDQVQNVLENLPQTDTDKGNKENVKRMIKVSAILNAHEDLLTETHKESEAVEDLSDAVSAELDRQVEEYAQEQKPGEIIETIHQEISEIGALTENDTNASSTSDIENHIEEVSDKIQAEDLEGALQAVIDAKVQAVAQDYTEETVEE